MARLLWMSAAAGISAAFVYDSNPTLRHNLIRHGYSAPTIPFNARSPFLFSAATLPSEPPWRQASNVSGASTTEELLASPLLDSVTEFPNELLDPIVHHPSVATLAIDQRPRHKLKPRHAVRFVNLASNSTAPPTLLEKLATACCDSGVVPRKEFYETYASAVVIDANFPSGVHRVADLAAGHGLLAWMLLALDRFEPDGSERPREIGQSLRTAVCLDRRIPPSAVAIARSMRKHVIPVEGGGTEADGVDEESNLYDCHWTYVQTDLRNAVVDGDSTLLVSVHACGTLSDYLIGVAIAAGAPLALVPCCHTAGAKKGYRPHPVHSPMTADAVRSTIQAKHEALVRAREGENEATTIANPKFRIVENVLDEVRYQTLRNAGYRNLTIASLPREFTERNRLFLAVSHSIPSSQSTKSNENNSSSSSSSKKELDTEASFAASKNNRMESTPESFPEGMKNAFSPLPEENNYARTKSTARKGSMPAPLARRTPPPSKQDSAHPPLAVPLRDDAQSVEVCLALSGRARAIQRLRETIPNHVAPKLDVTLWLGPSPTSQDSATTTTAKVATLEALQSVLDETVAAYVAKGCHTRHQTKQTIGLDIFATLAPIQQLFVHPKTGRQARTYQLTYSYATSLARPTFGEDGSPFPKAMAKELHQSFCYKVRSIEGVDVR